MDDDSTVQDVLTDEATRAALKSLDPRYYDEFYMLPSRISHTDIPLGTTSSAPGMSDIWHGSRTSTGYGLPPVSQVGFETGQTEARLLSGNSPYVYATTEPDISQMLAEREGRGGTVIKGQVPTESLRGGISTVPGAFGGDPRYPNYDPETEAFIRSRGFDPKMAETEFLLTPENANRAFGFSPGDATVAPRSRVGPFDLGQTAAQQAQGARIPLSAALKGISGAVLNTGPKVGEYIGSAKDFLPGLKQKAITGAGTAARFAGPLSIPLDLWAANQWFGEGAPARGVAALASTVFPPAILAELGLTAGASIQDAARQAGEYLTSPENPLPGIFPEGTPDLTGNVPLQQDIRAEDSTLTDRFGDYVASRNVYEDVDVLDTTAEQKERAENIYDAYSPEEQSQSAQALIRSFTETPEVASLVSRRGDRRAAVEEALETYLPSAMGIDDPSRLTTARQGIMDLISWDKYEEAGKAGEFGADFDYIPAQVSSGVGGDLPSVRTLAGDRQEWTAASIAHGTGTKIPDEVVDKHNLRRHVDLIFGASLGEMDTPDPTVGSARQEYNEFQDRVPQMDENARALGTWFHDNPGQVQDIVNSYQNLDSQKEFFDETYPGAAQSQWLTDRSEPVTKQQKKIKEDLEDKLRDLVNNQVLYGARDLGQTKEQAYNNPNAVVDEKKFSGLAQALLEEKVNINQLDSALELARADSDRVIETFTEQGLRDITTQVESFSEPIVERTPPVKKEVKKAKPVKKKKSAAVKAAERDASAEKAAKERAEMYKAAAKTESQRARAEQSRLEALSRQRAAEERARQAAQSAAQKAEADRIKKAQQSASAAALASMRMAEIEAANRRRDQQMRLERARLYGDAFDPSGWR